MFSPAKLPAAQGPSSAPHGGGGGSGGSGGNQMTQSVVVNSGQSATTVWLFVFLSVGFLTFVVFLQKQQQQQLQLAHTRARGGCGGARAGYEYRDALERGVFL